MQGPGFRFACLWLSQTARVFADWCLRLDAILTLAEGGGRQLNAAAYLVTAVFIAPFVVLAPVNGALCNALRKRRVLVGSAAFCLVASVLTLVVDAPRLLLVAAFGVGMAVYSPTRYALLPAAAEETGYPLSRVTGWIEMGGALAIVGGAILGRFLHDLPPLVGRFPPALAAAVVLCAIGLVAALPVRFSADVWRPEPPVAALVGFSRDAGRVLRAPVARGTLLGLAAFMALVTAGSNALVNYTLDPSFANGRAALLRMMVLVAIGGAAGSWLAGRPRRLDRCLGLVPLAATGLLVALGWAMTVSDPSWPCLALGVTTGMANVPLRSFYQAVVPADARGNGMAIMNTTLFLANTALSAFMFLLTALGFLGTATSQVALLAALAAAATALAWWFLGPNLYRATAD